MTGSNKSRVFGAWAQEHTVREIDEGQLLGAIGRAYLLEPELRSVVRVASRISRSEKQLAGDLPSRFTDRWNGELHTYET